MDGRCKTCSYWLRPVDKWKRGMCLFIHEDNAASRAETSIFPKARRGQNAELRTAPDFGCVEWQAKKV